MDIYTMDDSSFLFAFQKLHQKKSKIKPQTHFSTLTIYLFHVWTKKNRTKSSILYFCARFRAFIAAPVPVNARGRAPFPKFRWADRQLMWDLLAKRETGTYSRLAALPMLQKHPALQEKMRAILLGKGTFFYTKKWLLL